MSEYTSSEITVRGPSKPDRMPIKATQYGGDWALFATIDGREVIIGEAFSQVESDVIAPAHANARLWAAASNMLAALEEIAKGEGRFSRDPLTHATNTVEDMQALAVAAIAKATEES